MVDSPVSHLSVSPVSPWVSSDCGDAPETPPSPPLHLSLAPAGELSPFLLSQVHVSDPWSTEDEEAAGAEVTSRRQLEQRWFESSSVMMGSLI